MKFNLHTKVSTCSIHCWLVTKLSCDPEYTKNDPKLTRRQHGYKHAGNNFERINQWIHYYDNKDNRVTE